MIDTWELKAKDKVTLILELEDVESEKHCMEKVSSWTYLGDVIQNNGKNDLNIQNRIQRGAGAKQQVLQMLEGSNDSKILIILVVSYLS